MFAVIFDCDFEGSTGCGLTMNGFAKASYRSTEILDPPDKSDFGGKYLKCPTLLFSQNKDDVLTMDFFMFSL